MRQPEGEPRRGRLMRVADITPGLRVRVRRFAHRTLDSAGTVIDTTPGRKARVRLDDGQVVTVAVQRVQPMGKQDA